MTSFAYAKQVSLHGTACCPKAVLVRDGWGRPRSHDVLAEGYLEGYLYVTDSASGCGS